MSTWWRRNRWALLALPLVAGALVLVGSYRVHTFWDRWQLTEPVEATAGRPTTFNDTLEDANGSYEVALTVEAGPTTVAGAIRDAEGQTHFFPTHEGTRVWQTELTITADPDTILSGCSARLVDTEGRTTHYTQTTAGVPLPVSPCVPADATGPGAELGFGGDATPAPTRPETFTVPVVFRTAEDFVPNRLDLSWSTPRYLSIQLDVEEGP